jgi:hypothetical protein
VAHPRTSGRGRRGDGSISERTKADGAIVYDTYWHYPDPITGKIKRAFRRGFATRRDAARHLKTQTAAADAGSYVPPTRQRLDDYLEQWLGALRLAPQTIAAYRTHVRRHITPRIDRIKPVPCRRSGRGKTGTARLHARGRGGGPKVMCASRRSLYPRDFPRGR